MSIALIAAMSRNRVIGRDGHMPWRLRDDMRRFRQVTMGHPVIMGRATWESLLRRPLAGRSNLVVSRDYQPDAGAEFFTDPESAVEAGTAIARRDGLGMIFVIGGASLYSWALPLANLLYLSEIDAEIEGDRFFPEIDHSQWELVKTERFAAGSGNDHAFSINEWHRRG